MEKLAVGPQVDPRRVSLRYSVAHNLEAIANCLGKPVRRARLAVVCVRVGGEGVQVGAG
jgi:fructose-1,6-bisphosphatase/sedoheptulose 1,7-bisphosphatase-like protein